MEPDFRDGDLVLINTKATPAIGTAVIARHPFKNLDVIKYVDEIDDDGFVQVRSPAGDDSRQFGRIPLHTIRGTVTINVTAERHSR